MFYHNYNKTYINIYIKMNIYKLNLDFKKKKKVKIQFKFILKYNENTNVYR